jgi:hypothetical protein
MIFDRLPGQSTSRHCSNPPRADLLEEIARTPAAAGDMPSACILSSMSLLLNDAGDLAVQPVDDLQRGRPFGPIRPCQFVTSYPGTPDSATVGRLGSAAIRCGVVTASARARVRFACGTTGRE